jgi:hypothetical protein
LREVVQVLSGVGEADEDVDAAHGQHVGEGDGRRGWPVALWLDVEAGAVGTSMPVANCRLVDVMGPAADLWPCKPCPTVGATIVGMVMADATEGSEGEGWGKETAAICGSGLQDTGFYPGSPPTPWLSRLILMVLQGLRV